MNGYFEVHHGVSLANPEQEHLDLIRRFATPYGYAEERDGAVVHDVTPVAGYEATESSRGTARFGAHSDCAFLSSEYRPEFLSLFCRVNDAGTPTLLWEAERIVDALPARWVEVLSAPRFQQAAPQSFDWVEEPPIVEDHRVLDLGPGYWHIAYSAQGTRPTDPEAARALDALDQTLRELEPGRAEMRPGSLLIFNNLRCLHGRDAIAGNRWLQRIYSRRDVAMLERNAATDRAGVFSARAAAAAHLPRYSLALPA